MTLASAGGGFSFSFQLCCKSVIEAYRFHLHLSPPLISLWSAACLPSVSAPRHCWFLYDILSRILLLQCGSVLMYTAIKFKPQRGRAPSVPPPLFLIPLLSVAAEASLTQPFQSLSSCAALFSFDFPFFSPVSAFSSCSLSVSVSFPFYPLHVNKQSNGVAGSSCLWS